METFVEITNSAKVRSNTNLVISGIQANKNFWNQYSFYPNKGVVGIIIGEAQCSEGTILIVQCADDIVVPVLPDGVSEITYSEFSSRYPLNMQVGKTNSQQMNSAFDVDEMMDSIEKMFGF